MASPLAVSSMPVLRRAAPMAASPGCATPAKMNTGPREPQEPAARSTGMTALSGTARAAWARVYRTMRE